MMKTIIKDRNTPFEITAKHDHSITSVIENIEVMIPVHSIPENKAEYKRFNMMKLLYGIKRGKLILIQTDKK